MNNNTDIFIGDIERIAESIYRQASVLEGKTLLITGGSGFLGRYITSTISFLDQNYFKRHCRIISIDNNITSSVKDNLPFINNKKFTFIKHNIKNPINLSCKIDYIIHAAGIASPIYYHKYQLETIEVAVVGTKNILELSRSKKVKSLLFFSSSEIYGDPPADCIPTKETYKGIVSSIGPRSCYDESKRLGESLCLAYFNKYRVPVKITRPFNIYGPGMKYDDYRVIPSFIYSALKKRNLIVHAKGVQTRSFCYISDATIGFFQILFSNKKFNVFNIGNEHDEISISRLAKYINQIFNNKLTIRSIKYPKDYPQDEPQRRCPDLTKARVQLGYDPVIDLETGLRRTIEWCINNWNLKK